jgi:antitoxin component YwqK of YwqJK toxin-antitoxin module
VVTYKVVKEKSKVKYGFMKGREIKESVKDGHSASYSAKDFRKTEEGDFKNGNKDGEWIAYYPGGKMAAIVTNYKEGELDGPMKQYDRRGKITSEINYKGGIKHGKFIVYNENGKVTIEKTFANGMEVKGGTFSPK